MSIVICYGFRHGDHCGEARVALEYSSTGPICAVPLTIAKGQMTVVCVEYLEDIFNILNHNRVSFTDDELDPKFFVCWFSILHESKSDRDFINVKPYRRQTC